MTISFAFSQEMILDSKFFHKNIDVITPYKWITTKNTKGDPTFYKDMIDDKECAFSFETYPIETSTE